VESTLNALPLCTSLQSDESSRSRQDDWCSSSYLYFSIVANSQYGVTGKDVVELSDTQVAAQVARLLDTAQGTLQQMQHLLHCLDERRLFAVCAFPKTVRTS
jgi:phytoene/squalene synthetase